MPAAPWKRAERVESYPMVGEEGGGGGERGRG